MRHANLQNLQLEDFPTVCQQLILLNFVEMNKRRVNIMKSAMKPGWCRFQNSFRAIVAVGYVYFTGLVLSNI